MLAQIRSMREWVMEVEHIFDGSWASRPEEVSNAEVGLPCGEALCVTDSGEGGGFCSCDPRSPHENRESKKRSSLRRTGIWLVIERSRTPVRITGLR